MFAFTHPSGTQDEDLILPTTHTPKYDSRPASPIRRPALFHPKNRRRVLLLITFSFFVTTFFRWSSPADPPHFAIQAPSPFIQAPQEQPPDDQAPYTKWWLHEQNLPQHNLSLPAPEGANGRYLLMANHIWGLGLNNVLQEHMLNGLLAYESRRAFAFDPFIVSFDDTPFSDDHGKLVPTRIPFSSIISGPLVGAPFPPSVQALEARPRAVTRAYFEQVCPNPTVITDQAISGLDEATAEEKMAAWVDLLLSIEDRCVRIDHEREQIFNHYIFGSPRVLDIWPRLSSSPILRNFDWSSLVHSALYTNAARLVSPSQPSLLSRILSFFTSPFLAAFSSSSSPTITFPVDASIIPGLLALHIRRGDFEKHCSHLTNWSAPFNGFNALPGLPDPFAVLPGAGWGTTTPENVELYSRRCFPSISDIATKVVEVRMSPEGRGLRRAYVMTNGDSEWVAELKEALMALGGWDTASPDPAVTIGSEMVLTKEQDWIAQAVDMDIAQRAQVFIGNGFSSMTSNVVLLRLAKELPSNTIRFW